MYLDRTQYRSFYPQRDFEFNFDISDYSSQNFEIGLSGSDYIYFNFTSGIIKDHFGNIIGTFNGNPISINSSLQDGSYNYSLNEKEISRDLNVNPTSIFSSIVAKILDNKAINLNSYLYGTEFTKLSFYNFHSLNGLKGKIVNEGNHIVEIFSIVSSTEGGTWNFPKLLQPGVIYEFYNSDLINFSDGSLISFNLDTNFGKQSYLLRVSSENNTNDSTVDENFEIEEIGNSYSNIIQISGELNSEGIWTGVYQLDYAGGLGNYANLDFEYFNAKVKDIVIFKDLENTILYKGTLRGENGKGAGTMIGNNPVIRAFHREDESNAKEIDFYPVNKSKYFENVYLTGEVIYSTTLDKFKNFSQYNVDLSQYSYLVDLGGTTEEISSPLDNSYTNYYYLVSYKGLQISSNSSVNITGKIIDETYNGKYFFGELEYQVNNPILIGNDLLYSNLIVNDDKNKKINISPYRGVSFATLPDDQKLFLSGPENGSLGKPYLILDSSYDTFFYKNLQNIDFGGKYTINTNEQVYGRILDKNYQYKRQGSDFSLTTSIKNAEDVPNSIVNDSISFYSSLKPFDLAENVNETLIEIREDNEEVTLPSNINWNDNNFIAFKNKETISPFYYKGSPLFCYSFDKNVFLYNYNTNDLWTNNNGLNMLFEYPTQTAPRFYDGKNLSLDLYIKNNTDVELRTSQEDKKLYIFYFNENATPYYIYLNKLTCRNENSNQGLIIPFQPIEGIVSYTFSFFTYRPASNYVRYIQISLDDGISAEPQYLNIDLQGLVSQGSILSKATRRQIPTSKLTFTDESLDAVQIQRYSVTFDIKVNRKVSFIKINFIDNYNSEKDSIFTGDGLKNIYIGGMMLERGVTQGSFFPSDYEIKTVVAETLSNAVLFSYFIHKIYNIDGYFSRISRPLIGSNLSFIADETQYGKNGRDNFTKDIERGTIQSYKGENIEVVDSLGWKLRKFFDDVILQGQGSLLSELYVSKRGNKLSFFSIGTDFNSIFLEKNGEIVEYLINDTEHGEAIEEIINAIKKYNPQYSKIEYFSKQLGDDKILKNVFPEQLQNQQLVPIDLKDLSSIIFSGQLSSPLNMYIPMGFGRYYPNNNNPETKGWFWETATFNFIRNESCGDNGYLNVFPNTKYLLNSQASIERNTSLLNDFDTKLTKLVKINSPIKLYYEANTEVYLNEADMEFSITETSSHSGLFENFKESTKNVWDVKMTDDEDGLVNQVDVLNQEIDLDKYTVNSLSNDDSDNSLQSKFLTIKRIKNDTESLAKITLYIKNQDQILYTTEKRVP